MRSQKGSKNADDYERQDNDRTEDDNPAAEHNK
jgi:hypothetical protein